MEMRPNTLGCFCPLCEEWLEYVDWPSDWPRRPVVDHTALAEILRVAGDENEAMLREHMAGHTAEVMLDR